MALFVSTAIFPENKITDISFGLASSAVKYFPSRVFSGRFLKSSFTTARLAGLPLLDDSIVIQHLTLRCDETSLESITLDIQQQ